MAPAHHHQAPVSIFRTVRGILPHNNTGDCGMESPLVVLPARRIENIDMPCICQSAYVEHTIQ